MHEMILKYIICFQNVQNIFQKNRLILKNKFKIYPTVLKYIVYF